MHRLSRLLLVGAMVLAGLVAPAVVSSQPAWGAETASGAHPRLLFGVEEVPALRQRIRTGEPALAWAKLKEKVDSYTTPGHPNYVDPALVNDPTPVTVREGGLKLGENPDWAYYENIVSQNQMRSYLLDLAFGYVLSGQERYGRHAVELLLELSVHWPAWNGNELGEGGLTAGVALAFDWTYGLMSVEERRRITDSLVGDLRQTNPVARDGSFPAPSVFSCLDRDFGFDGTAFNWTGVCGGGNGLTLLAIEGEPGVPDLEPWMTVARDRVFPYLAKGFGSRGDGAEGATYGAYGLHNGLPFAFAYERMRGTDAITGTGLAELPAWLAFEQLPGRGTRFVPRNDSQEAVPLLHEVIPMLFEIRPDGLTGWLYDHTMGAQGDATFTSEPVFVAHPVTGNHTCTDPVEDPTRLFFCWRSAEVFTILYHRGADELPRTDPSEVTERSRFYPEYGLVNARTGWQGGQDEVVATFEAKHDHPDGHFQEDLGNFSLYGYGDRFAVDSSYGNNYSCNDFFTPMQGCRRGDPVTHAGRAIGHNVPIVGEWRDTGRRTQFPFGARATKKDTIGTYLDSPDRTLVRSDLRNAYDVNQDGQPGDVRYAERDLLFSRTPGQPVMLATADRLNLDGQPHDYEWQMHTDGGNVVTGEGNRFTVRGPSGATLAAAVTDAASSRSIDLEPWVEARYNPFDQPLTHTVIVSGDETGQPQPAMEHLAVTALTAPGEQPAVVEQAPATGGSVVSAGWVTGEALFASASYGSAGVLSDRLTTDGDLVQVTVLPTGVAGAAAGAAAETVLAAGSSLVVDGRSYVEVVGGAATVVASGDTVRAEGPTGATYRVLAPQQIDAVTVGGAPVRSCRDGDYLLFPCRVPTTLTLLAPTSAPATDAVELTATLTASGEGLAGQAVTFSVDTLSVSGVTDRSGVATVRLPLDLDAGSYLAGAHFLAHGNYGASAATAPLQVVPDETSLVYTGETNAQGETVAVSAILTEDDGVGLAGQPVSFTVGTASVTAITDADGRAAASVDVPDHGRSQPVAVRYSGTARYAAAAADATVTWGQAPP